MKKIKYTIYCIVVIFIVLFYICLRLLISVITEINFILANLVSIWNGNLMMDNISSAYQNIGNIGSSNIDITDSSKIKISPNDKPQNVPLFKVKIC